MKYYTTVIILLLISYSLMMQQKQSFCVSSKEFDASKIYTQREFLYLSYEWSIHSSIIYWLIGPWKICIWFKKNAIFNLVLLIYIFRSDDNALRWMPQALSNGKSTSVQVMAWCHQATSHYLSQCWPKFMLPYGIPRPQWVKACIPNTTHQYYKLTYVNQPLNNVCM